MRRYYALVPYAQDGAVRGFVTILPEVELIVRGVRAGVFCTDADGVENPFRSGAIAASFVKDCWLTAAALIEESNDTASDAMYAEFTKNGRIKLQARSLDELADQCRRRLAQHLAAAPPVVQNAWTQPDPLAWLATRVSALTDPGDVTGFAAMKAWVLSICNRDPLAVVFPPGMRPVGGQITPRYGALFALKDAADSKAATHFLRVAFAIVDAAIYQGAVERLP